jgi:hypothetical protein
MCTIIVFIIILISNNNNEFINLLLLFLIAPGICQYHLLGHRKSILGYEILEFFKGVILSIVTYTQGHNTRID